RGIAENIGFHMEIIGVDEIKKLNPFFDTAGVLAGAWTLDDGHADHCPDDRRGSVPDDFQRWCTGKNLRAKSKRRSRRAVGVRWYVQRQLPHPAVLNTALPSISSPSYVRPLSTAIVCPHSIPVCCIRNIVIRSMRPSASTSSIEVRMG
ncbi:MAG: hypothetical protein E2O59_03740, partial [Gammaproteobacteria bacterium]